MKNPVFSSGIFALSLLFSLSTFSEAKYQEITAENVYKVSLKSLLDVHVVAQKRLESQQQVPVSLYSFSSQTLDLSQAFRSEDIAKLGPSVGFDKRIDFTKSSMKIRGVGTLVFGAGVEPSVATFVDGVVMARGGAGFFELYDIDRIEVLLGPQSTLFGKNASAGLLHIISKKPVLNQRYSNINFWASDDQDYRGVLTTNQPLNEQTALRINVQGRQYAGNVDNLFNGDELNGIDDSAIRGHLRWSGNNTELLFSLDYSQQDSTQGVRVLRVDSESIFTDPAAIGDTGTPATAGVITGITGSADNTQVNLNRAPLAETEAYGISLDLQWQLKPFTISSLSSWRSWVQENDRDNDQTQLAFSLKQLENRDVSWYSQEFRLTSKDAEWIDYVAGVYYYHSENIDTSGDERTFSHAPYLFEFNLADNSIINENLALFGQLDFHLQQAWTLSVGLRGLYDKVAADLSRTAFTQNNSFLSDGLEIANRDLGSTKNEQSFTRLIGKGAVMVQLKPEVMSYLSYARGFKGAAFNTSFKFDTQIFLEEEPVKPEESDTVEFGLRSQIYTNQQLNASLFYTQYKGLQLTMRDLENNRNIIGSVDKVISQGLEVSYTALFADKWLIQAHYSYLDASYKAFSNANCYAHQSEAQGCISLPGGNVQDLSGSQLVNAPKHKTSVLVRYQWPWQQFLLAWHTQARAQSNTNLDSAGNPNAEQAAYAIWDMGLSLASEQQHWQTRITIKNMFDQQYINGITINGNAGGDLVMQLIPRDFERFIGISFNWQIQ